MNKEQLCHQLEVHEGKKLTSYICPAGHLTVGIGHNLIANPATAELGRRIDRVGMTITEAEAMQLLDHDIEHFTTAVRTRIPEFDRLSEPRQHVLIDMAFNMGMQKLLEFRKMLAALRKGDFEAAATEMLDSDWAHQVKNRATRLAMMMRDNKTFADVEHAVA
jgi:lysozyme